MGLRDALATATEVASALVEAHQHRVVHRDIKPQNILISSRSQAKVVDFGIAKRLATAGGSLQTMTVVPPGVVAGTVAYMSPEQARAEELDERSDIFSFGIVLCEMFTGRHPFARPTPAETLAAIVGAAPRVDSIPDPRGPVLVRVVGKCLEADKSLRYQSTVDLLTDLRRVSERNAPGPTVRDRRVRRPMMVAATVATLLAAVAGAEICRRSLGTDPLFRSVAVLPFVNVDLGSELDYQVDGITDSIITRLSRAAPDLRVISHEGLVHLREEITFDNIRSDPRFADLLRRIGLPPL